MADDKIKESAAMLKGIVSDSTSTEFTVVEYFDIIEDESCAVEASITDNYVESNYSIQDHVAIKPKIYRLRGFVGEAVYRNVNLGWGDILKDFNTDKHPVLQKTLTKVSNVANSSFVNKMKSGLTVASAVSPIVGSYTKTAININNQLKNSFNRYKQIYKNLNHSYALTNKRQQSAVTLLNRLLETRTPVSLKNIRFASNPLNLSEDDNLFLIQSVSSKQGDSNYITDIEITIKEFRIAKTKTTNIDKNKYGTITEPMVQKASESNNGIAQGQTLSTQKVLGKDTLVTVDDKAKMSKIIGNNVVKEIGGKKYSVSQDKYGTKISAI